MKIDKDLKAAFKNLPKADRERVEITKLIILRYLMELALDLQFVHPDLADTLKRFVDKKGKEI